MDLIFDGAVSVNGRKILEPSFPVDPLNDQIAVEGRPVRVQQFTYILLNKPAGYVTTKSDRFAEKLVLDLLPHEYHFVSPVGRLDKDTEGLLLLMNDGDLAFRLTHPSHLVEKVYFVKVGGRLTDDAKKRVETGVVLDGKKTAPAKVHIIHCEDRQTTLEMTIREGRKRQIRRMFEEVGHKVEYLQRTKEGAIDIRGLKTGQWRFLTPQEIEGLKKL